MKTKNEITREEWLQQAIRLMTPLFKKVGYEVPQMRVSVGWPSSRGKSNKHRVLGECWDKAAADDGKIAQIFVTPMYKTGEVASEAGVLPTLVHEVVHAVVGNAEGHNKVFGKCARAVGLEGKLTSTHAGEALLKECKVWAKELGEFPHSGLNPSAKSSGKKKQTTRMVKCECTECGYTCRTTRKWLEDAGAPHCPKHGVMAFEMPEELEGDDE